MAFDITCAVIFVLCVLVGYMKGIVRAVFLVGCVAAAYYASQPLTPPIADFLHRWTGLGMDVTLVAGQAAAGLAIYAICSIISDLLARRLERDEQGVMKGWNRQLGALVGLACGAALIFAAVCVADALVERMPRRQSYLFRALRSSRLRRYVSDINPLRKKMDGQTDLWSGQQSRRYQTGLVETGWSKPGCRSAFTGARDWCKIEDRRERQSVSMEQGGHYEISRRTRRGDGDTWRHSRCEGRTRPGGGLQYMLWMRI